MNDVEFIVLVLRYLDGEATRAQTDALGTEMLDQADRRALYRDLVRQSQLVYQWQSPLAKTTARRASRPLIAGLSLAAAAAALIFAATVLLVRLANAPLEASVEMPAVAPPPADYFGDRNPAWSDIYRSPFDYPDFVWRAEIPAGDIGSETFDDLSDGDIPPLTSTTPAGEFQRLLAPIALLPAGENFGSHLY